MLYNEKTTMERSAKTNFILVCIAFALITAGYFAWAHAQVVGVTLPSIPADVRAAAQASPGEVNVSWSASTETSGTIEGYYVYRNGVQVTATADTSYLDAGLLPGDYAYNVVAYDANGYESQQSATANVTLVADTTPPTAPTDVTVSGPTSTDSYYAQLPVTISWSASTDKIGVVGYYVYRNDELINSTTSPQSGTSITDTLGPGTYTYTVAAYDAAQNVSARSSPVVFTISIDNTPPSVPTNVSVEQISANGAKVSWASSTDPGGIAGYQIFRNGSKVGSASSSPYTDQGLSTNVHYIYNVAAYDVAGNVSDESEPPAGVTIQPFTGPNPPVILSAIVGNASTVEIIWSIASDPLAITGYTLYRDGAAIASVTSTSYIDTKLTPGLHTYNLTTTDVSGETSAMSASSTVIVPATGTTAIPIPVAPPLPIAISTSSSAIVTIPSNAVTITQSLYYGLQSTQVNALQAILAENGYLASDDVTGFFGNLTLSAVEKFQCNENIVCTGDAGWGTVGPKTRTALSSLSNTNSPVSATASASSTTAMLAQLQTLEAELATLEAEQQQSGTLNMWTGRK